MSRWGTYPEENHALADLRSATPARVGVGRAGLRPGTQSWLRFRQDHAMAKDAVAGEFSEILLDYVREQKFELVQTQALNKLDFIAYPPKGKHADLATINRLKSSCASNLDVQIVISDGLSSQAIEDNLRDILPMIIDGFKLEGITYGVPIVVRYGRVAVADQIAHALGMRLALNLIGERPGLSTPGSMSAYLTYNPSPNTISSDRTVVSNIHALGTLPVEAGAHIVQIAKRILNLKMSGVKLQQTYTG
ncbi:MAG: ethanolamine ammonia-lyase subunit EutC [Candidatus Melainabacteria bacterium]|nr:ethanolamine ammonia-lyase subunit EutC [Candidatus Melainabacteria bacterium]